MALEDIDANDYRKFMENERWNIKFRRALANRLFQYLSIQRSDVRLVDMRVPTVVQLVEKDDVQGFVLHEAKGGDRFSETLEEHFLPAAFAFGATTVADTKGEYLHYLRLKTGREEE
jgi:hypothetical protein